MTFLKGLDECQEKTDVLVPGKVILVNNLELIMKYKKRARRALYGTK
ncbi:MAG: hypothetical protein WCS56_00340 [Bacilli bacterium]